MDASTAAFESAALFPTACEVRASLVLGGADCGGLLEVRRRVDVVKLMRVCEDVRAVYAKRALAQGLQGDAILAPPASYTESRALLVYAHLRDQEAAALRDAGYWVGTMTQEGADDVRRSYIIVGLHDHDAFVVAWRKTHSATEND